LVATAQGRIYPELKHAALAEDVDLIYGGTNGALAAVARAARQMGVPYALDLEDFHSAEQEDEPASRLFHHLMEQIESRILPGAAFLTAGSDAIADAYAERYGVKPITVNNTFPLPATPPDLTVNGSGVLKLYWFSQTVGPQRGLEDAVRAMALAHIPGELHLRGRAIPEYLESLRRLAGGATASLKIIHHEPAPPDAMFELCRGYDVGLALEQPHTFNRSICLTNKAFTYMLGGLAVVFTETLGQRALAMDLGEASLLYNPGNVQALAAGLKLWADNKELLARSKAAAWEAARRRWHWEHQDERGALLKAVTGALGN
jgi:glycosyltransferase involved in cell wall biosynthesis